MPYLAWQATEFMKNDGLFSNLPVSIVLHCQHLSRIMTLLLHVSYMHACMPAMKATKDLCMHDIV